MKQQGVQGLQPFAFCLVTVNNEQMKGFKESLGVKFKDELRLKLWFESDWYFCNITESGWF